MKMTRFLLCLVAALALTGGAVPAAFAADSGAAGSAAKKKSSHKKAGHSARVVKSPSEESRAERDRRLQRECKGRPNAGACLGYAS